MSGRVDELVRELDMRAHPEGGWFREVFRAATAVEPVDGRGSRSGLTSIYFLMARGQHSAWHRVESDEAWIHFEGDGVRLWTFDPAGGAPRAEILGPLGEGSEPQRFVGAGIWQAAEPLGAYSLTGAAVGPGFDFADFRLLDADDAARRWLEEVAPDLLRLA